jgi:hypothetical protein
MKDPGLGNPHQRVLAWFGFESRHREVLVIHPNPASSSSFRGGGLADAWVPPDRVTPYYEEESCLAGKNRFRNFTHYMHESLVAILITWIT